MHIVGPGVTLRLGLLIALAGVVGCSAGESAATKPRAVVTTGMVGDLVRRVAGEHFEVVQLLQHGVDPHTYSPTRADVRLLRDADIVFYSGLLLEGRMTQAFEQVARGGKPVHAVAEGVERQYLRDLPDDPGHADPHVWMDVQAWSRCAEAVAKALSEFDPSHAPEYAKNIEAFQVELAELDEYVRRVIASIPEAQRLLVTAHDAFGYFSRAYDIPVESIQGISTESEAGVHDINRLVKLIVDRKVKAIFVESSVPPKNIRAVIEGAAAQGWQVEIGGELFSDAMGALGTYEGTYVGMIDHNATIIARALGGEAPEKGLRGRLASEPSP
jgi:manganese/zinc/iron transport system substrate-binding protein